MSKVRGLWLFHSLIYLCNFDSDFAYLLFASLGLFSLFVCLFVSTLLLAYCRVHCVNLAMWLLYDNTHTADICDTVCFRMTFAPTPSCPQSVCNMFSVTPAEGTVGPNDKPVTMQISVVPKRELTMKDQPILQCRAIEARRPSVRTSVTAGSSPSGSLQSALSVGEAIVTIPIRVSCQSSYSKHVLLVLIYYPANAMLVYVLSDIISAIIIHNRLVSVFMDISFVVNFFVWDRYCSDDATNRRAVLNIGTYLFRTFLLLFWGGGIPKGPKKSKFWPFNKYCKN